MLVLLAALFIVISGLNAGLAFIESKVAVTARLADGTSFAALTPGLHSHVVDGGYFFTAGLANGGSGLFRHGAVSDPPFATDGPVAHDDTAR